MPSIALNFEDGFTRIIEGWDGETVANTAYRMGINVPMDCGDGACGTCKCRVLSGRYDLGDDYIEDALSASEAAEGLALACQMKPETNVVVDVFASSKACKVKANTFATQITDLERLSSEIVKVIVRTADGHRINYLPGQYANIEIPGSGHTRSYSFCGMADSNRLEFLVRLLPDGVASNYFRYEANVGDTLQMTGPYGSFYLRDLQHPAIFFAGGTGIAPFLAMLEKLSIESISQPIKLFYGATTDENLVELARLDTYKDKLPFTYHTSVSGQPSQVHANGFVTQWVTRQYLGADTQEAYICGPPPMVDSVKAAIASEGITLSNFHMEKFLPSGI